MKQSKANANSVAKEKEKEKRKSVEVNVRLLIRLQVVSDALIRFTFNISNKLTPVPLTTKCEIVMKQKS